MNKNYLLILFFISFTLFFSYNYFDSKVSDLFNSRETVHVDRIIDGDTIVSGNFSIRLLGINSPEKGEIGYSDAKDFLINTILNKTVTLDFGREKYDLYHRKLAYIYFEGRNINLESVKNGFSSPYFPSGKTKYYSEFFYSWNECLEKNIGICKSRKENCLNFLWEPNEDKITIENLCNFKFDLDGYSLKDEGRKKFVFEKFLLDKKTTLTNENFSKKYVWTSSGDSIFIRDEKNNLIYFNHY